MTPVVRERPARLAVIGTGDVAGRRYLPALAALGDKVDVVGLVDPNAAVLDAAWRAASATWPGVTAYPELGQCLAGGRLDGAIDLTPAPLHATVNQACLDAGVSVYTEKPLAGTLVEANGLIETATKRNLLFLAAPGESVTRRGRWLAEIVASGRLGPLTLAVAHHADSGPATWREYTGDPTVFYGPAVGPVFDHGIYRLHLLTSLLGPVKRVQAMGTIGVPERTVRAGPLAGRTIKVTAPDHVLINLEFVRGALGQLLASFGTANTQAPWLELHFTKATLSFAGASHDPEAPASLYLEDDSPLGLEGWIHGLRPPPPDDGVGAVEAGVRHFVDCLRGEDEPALTAEHARHVLDVILKAYAAIEDGRSHETETTF